MAELLELARKKLTSLPEYGGFYRNATREVAYHEVKKLKKLTPDVLPAAPKQH
ncbi:MAG: hypothetical protein HKM04_02990 [Legionellales bacterium]|nr:hypothetical protein [Legionellales bacterium]